MTPPGGKRGRGPGSVRPWAAALALAVLVLAVYVRTAGFGFVDYDDQVYVSRNPEIARGLTWAGARWALTTLYQGQWHPLTWLSWMADASIHGARAGGYHLTNVILHLASVLLLFRVLAGMTGALWPSFLAAALFAVHPVHVESVAWVSERKDVLFVFFGLASIGAYLFHLRRPSPARYLLLLVAFGLGLASKPMLATLPLLLVLLDYWPFGRLGQGSGVPRGDLARSLAGKAPLLLMSLGAGAAAVYAHAAGGILPTLADLPLPARVLNVFDSYAAYLEKLVWPAGLTVFYPEPPAGPGYGSALTGLLVLGSLTWLAWRPGRPAQRVGWLWFLAAMAPVAGFLRMGAHYRADRFAYFPFIGLYLAAAWALADPGGIKRRFRPAAAVLAASAVLALTAAAWRQAGYWRDTGTLLGRALAVTSNNYLARECLGASLMDGGDYARAEKEFREAARIAPWDLAAYYNLGLSLARRGRTAEAAAAYREVFNHRPGDPRAHYLFGNILLESGLAMDAAAELREAIALREEYPEAHNKLGLALEAVGRDDEARAQFRRAVELNGRFRDARYNLGVALDKLGREDEAAAQYREAVRLDPSFAAAHNNLGILLARSGDLAGAQAHFSEALSLEPSNERARLNLEETRRRLRR